MNWGSAIRILWQMRDRGDDALRYMGLERRRSWADYVLPAVGYFAAGMVAGAGVALAFAPSSGRELRGEIGNRVNQFKGKVTDTTRQLRDDVAHQVAHTAHQIASSAESTASHEYPQSGPFAESEKKSSPSTGVL